MPSGYAVSSSFTDGSGDKITFYIVETPDGFVVEDDGDYLASLIARGIHIEAGARGKMLDAILDEARAYWDRETLEIKSEVFPPDQLGARAIDFLSSLIRVRDLALITRDRVRSAFRDDFIAAVSGRFDNLIEITENVAPANDLSEFPADIVLRPLGANGRTGAVYLVNTNDKLNEALLAWRELEDHPHNNIALMAVLEESEFKHISRRKFQRAQNRRMPMPIFRGDETGTLDFIGREMKIPI
ncbi:protein of unknown function DUF1828 [Sphingomonas laterariae]|uniref:DUF1828 domain-containing protein n=1 Tax=Edaphosphingomonas laterariae TaxID=861865 RepID=A0A239JH96_9SPHN|nr:protein of unknown function DUF1828 [Sphingomonas laterariae]